MREKMPLSALQFFLLIYLESYVQSSPFKPKGDDIIIIGGGSDGSGGGGPIVMDDGKRGKGSSTIIIIPPPPPTASRRDPFMDSMFGAASFETMPIMSPAPPPMGSHHMHPPPPPPPPYHRNMMPMPPGMYGDPMPNPSPPKKKKKKKKKSTTTTTTSTTTTTPAPVITPIYSPVIPYAPPEAPPAFENFYYSPENSDDGNNGYISGQSSYNMPAMMKMMQQYASGNDNITPPPDMSGGGSGMGGGGGSNDKYSNSNTFEFPKIPQIIIKVPAPIVNVPQPIVNVPAAIVNVSVPEIRIPQTQVTVPAPIVNVPTPVVNVPAANVSVNIPNIEVPPAVVNVPKKLVLKKEFRIASDHKPMGGGSRPVKPMKATSGTYTQMSDSEQIHFDDDDDESYTQAGSSYRQDQRIADTDPIKYSSPHKQPNTDYGSVVYAPTRPPAPPPRPYLPAPTPRVQRLRTQVVRYKDKEPAIDYSFHHNINQQSEPEYDRPHMVHNEFPESRHHHSVRDESSPDHTPIQQHFAHSPPLQYHPPSSTPGRTSVKIFHGGGGQQHSRKRPPTTSPPQNQQYDEEPRDQGESDHRNQHQEEEEPQRQTKSPPREVTEEDVIEFLRKNNIKPLTKNANLQVMRDDKKQPNIIFEKTESPVPESVSYESDQTIFDDRNPNAADAQNNQRNNDGIVFEEIPSHEFTAVAESEASVSDNMMYEDQKDSVAYSTTSQPIVQQSNSNSTPNHRFEATSAQESGSIRVNGKRGLIRRRKKIQSDHLSQGSTNSVATSSQSSVEDAITSRNQEARAQDVASTPASMPI